MNHYKREKIGTVTIAELGEPITENHTSYAADYRTLRVLPGTYDIELVGDSVYVTVDCDVLSDVTYSGFAGNNFASRDKGPHRSTKYFRLYVYEAAKMLAEGPAFLKGEAMLDEGWAIQVTYSTRPPLSDGETARTHVFRKFVKVA